MSFLSPADAAGLVGGLEDWVMASVSRVPLRDENDTVLISKNTENIQMTMQKMNMQLFKRRELASFPAGQRKQTGKVEGESVCNILSLIKVMV